MVKLSATFPTDLYSSDGEVIWSAWMCEYQGSESIWKCVQNFQLTQIQFYVSDTFQYLYSLTAS